MDLTVQILAKNNRTTIQRTIESVRTLSSEIIVVDLGSSDGTPELCSGCRLLKYDPRMGLDHIRESVVDKSSTDWQLFIQPWEVLAEGHEYVGSAKIGQIAKVIQDSIVTNEVRIWKKSEGLKFRNPVYEYIDTAGCELAPVYFYGQGRNDYRMNLELVGQWKSQRVFDAEPFYYQALTLLALGDYDGFINASEHYMFLDTNKSMSTVLNRYYYSLVQMYYKRKARPTFQNLALCIEAKPLMSEFWCLLGDVYYHLYRKFDLAKQFYEDAIFLGAKRMSTDLWPMDISKYEEYPGKMIENCKSLMKSQSLFVTSHHGV